jgi:hypothetical protein
MRFLFLVLSITAPPVAAQSTPNIDAAQTSSVKNLPCCTIPASTIVAIEIGATLSSRVNKPGETFPITLVEPIKAGEIVLVPAGAIGQGEVIHTAKSGGYGRAGEMLLAVRYLDFGGKRIALRSLGFQLGRGKSDEGNALAVGFIVSGLLPLFMKGGEMIIEKGTKAFAKISVDTAITNTGLAVSGAIK